MNNLSSGPKFKMGSSTKYTVQLGGDFRPAGRQIECQVERMKGIITILIHLTHIFRWCKCHVLPTKHEHAFKFFPQHPDITRTRIINLYTNMHLVVPLSYQCIACLVKFVLSIEVTDHRWILRKRFFSKIVPVFRKYLPVSWWNLPGYFSVSFRFPQVTEFGKSKAIYLADSFSQLYSALWLAWQEDPQERCAMVRTSCARL